MTEQEFLRQVWRAYDTIEIDGGMRGRVINVCFPTRSVQMNIPAGGKEWFRCELIVDHKCSTGQPDDDAMLTELHEKIMKQENRIETLQKIVDSHKNVTTPTVSEVRKCLNILNNNIVEKKKTVERIENVITRVENLLDMEENK